MKLKLHTDGGSRGNPGLAAVGGVLFDERNEIVGQFSRFIGTTTNNVAEYTALIDGLSLAKSNGATEVGCYLDSELVVKQLNGQYKVKDQNMKLLYAEVIKKVEMFNLVTFTHVPREQNENADTLVNNALDSL